MANYLDAHPAERERVRCAREYGLVPIVSGGVITHLTGGHKLNDEPSTDATTVEDYAVGLEVLGYRHHAVRQHDGSLLLMLTLPTHERPPEWDERASELIRTFAAQERGRELARFIVDRDGAVS